jgi:hypothetical protein
MGANQNGWSWPKGDWQLSGGKPDKLPSIQVAVDRRFSRLSGQLMTDLM